MNGPNDDTHFYGTLIHMLTIKRNSSNYLICLSQLLLLLTRKGLIDLVDGTPPVSSTEITSVDGKSGSNPAYTKWHTDDQRLISVHYSSLTVETRDTASTSSLVLGFPKNVNRSLDCRDTVERINSFNPNTFLIIPQA
ncbi:hypothetical protein ACS0TY_025851 [Phlomoides rotata]